MATCKAIVQEGPRKGEACKFPPSENGYCGRHERNRVYDEGITSGKYWCRFFFRGCNAELSEEEISKNEKSCKECREKLCKKPHKCEHSGCPFKVVEPGFCKKHTRDNYRKEAEEKGINYCDIDRGCFTICENGKKSCDPCLDKTRIVETKRYTDRKKLTVSLQAMNHTSKRLCVQCGKDFESFKTRYGKESVRCTSCNAAQAKQDVKRKDRTRNYKEENGKNLNKYFNDYVKGASKRGYQMDLQFDRFSELVLGECHYCGHKTEGEVNGIDRIDNAKGYSEENCVPACWKCNRIKHTYNKEFFIQKCQIISTPGTVSKMFYKTWKQYYERSCFKQYSKYIKEAIQRNLQVDINENQWIHITRSPCYLCGYQSVRGIGIDRVDNTVRKYTFDNCRPCCGSCNDMKCELPLSEFIDHCKRITQRITPEEPTESPEEPQETRKHWKALGLYYAILSDSASGFLDMYSEVYTREHFAELCASIKESTKEQAVKILKTLLQTLKKRKQRL